ncbi:unnamed protein product [Rotaria sordida]|uniref:Uncharacterized protein n=1 Tax=Rotaria sordida TaxID=392033 RepID=A0A819GG54_9BILA|nr:unnamed protein product [Rotaria sordida]CAF3882229.1 unnamed protein product [Rotaria sordida]
MTHENMSKSTNDYVIVWLDATIENSKGSQDTKALIRQLVRGRLRTFDDSNKCVDDITSDLSEKRIFLIVSNALGKNVVPHIYEIPEIQTIYIYCNNRIAAEAWAKSDYKISGIFTKKQELLQQIRDIVAMCDQDHHIPMSIFHRTDREKSLKDLSQQSVTSMWYQLILEVLRSMAKYGDSKAEMIEACRTSYHGDKIEQNKIDQFEEDYSPARAFYWYSSDSFVYRLLNKSLRTQDIEIIFKFRFFINDLHNELEKLYYQYINIHSSNPNHHLTVYRGQFLSMTELDRLKQSVNELISMNSFLSASLKPIVAEIFAGTNSQLNDPSALQSVLFIIDINNMSKEMKPFGFIQNYACNPDENEVLFSMGAIFKVHSVQEHDKVWHAHLELSKEQNQFGRDLLDHMLKQIKCDPGPLSFGWFLFRMNDFAKAERYAIWMMKQLPQNDIQIGDAYKLLGLIYKDTNRLDQSIKSYETALNIYSYLGYQDSPRAIATHCDLGLTYLAQKDNRYAYDEQIKAEEKLFKSLPTMHPLLIATVDSLKAKILIEFDDYSDALKNLQQVLQRKRQLLPAIHSSIASTLNMIGIVYEKMGNDVGALKYFQEALDIGEKSLIDDHLDLVEYHINVGRIYKKRGEFQRASKQVELAQKIKTSHETRPDDDDAIFLN